MQHSIGTFRGALGMELSYQTWHLDREVKAVLAIFHGHGEHIGRYGNVVNALVPRGFAVYGLDHRGHGRSRGRRGHINSWKEYREDVRLFLQLIEHEEPGRPVFLMGHSMGALVVLEYLIHYSGGLRGAVISGAPIVPVGIAKPYLVYLSRVLSKIWPSFPLRLALDTSALSRDAAVVRAYSMDPLVHGRFTARWGTEALDAVERVRANSAAVKAPILFIHGGADRLNSPEGIERLFEMMTVADKSLRIYPDMYHELHNDIGSEEVVMDVAEWLMERV